MADAVETAETLPARITGKELELAYRAILDGDVVPEIGDPEVVSRAIMARVMDAESFEDAFAPQSLKSWSDYLDVPVLVREVRLNKSTVKRVAGMPSVYAVVDIAFLTGNQQGEVETVSCGGRNVMIQLVKMLEKDWLDKPVQLVSKVTAEGFDVLWLVAA